MQVEDLIPRLERTANLWLVPGHVYELRSPKAGKFQTISGYYDNPQALVRDAASLTLVTEVKVPAVYVTLNPVSPELLARATNRIELYAKATSGDADVTRRLRLLVDADIRRKADISSTAAELKRAVDKCVAIRKDLSGLGFPDPALGDSGNGGHLLYGLDLPNDEATARLISEFLQALNARFGEGGADGCVQIDTTVFNASRISKFYGTLVRKGDHFKREQDPPELWRPHRLSQLIEAPATLEPVRRELLESVAGEWRQEQKRKAASAATGGVPPPPPPPPGGTAGTAGGPQSSSTPPPPPPQPEARPKVQFVREFIKKHDIGVRHEKPEGGEWLHRWVLVRCPFCESEDQAACVLIHRQGNIGYRCQHNRCSGENKKTWRDFVRHYEPDGSGLPGIVINGRQLRELRLDALDALCQYNDPVRYFTRGGVPVRLGRSEGGLVNCQVAKPPIMRHMLTDAADWFKATVKKGEVVKTAAYPPKDVVEDVLAAPRWPGLPPLDSITQTPVFLASGTLVSEPGYHAEGRLWLDLQMRLPPVPERPTAEQVASARGLLEELVCQFPFKGPADKANYFALLLLPFVRPVISDSTPLHLINAPQAGTGKDLLAKTVARIATGQEVATKTESHDEDEWRKNLTASLCEAPPLIYFENVNYALKSATLAKCLTSGRHRDRILGRNDQDRDLPVRCIWIATGNNVHMDRELTRRVVEIYIDANVEHPETREGFKHDLRAWAYADRPQFVHACLTLVRAWVAQGMPRVPPPRTIGNFEEWSKVMGGILHVAGIAGFMENWPNLSGLNTTEGEWEDFIHGWFDAFGGDWVLADDLWSRLGPGPFNNGSLLDGVLRGLTKPTVASLGMVLSKRKDTIICGYKVQHRPRAENPDKRNRYRLLPLEKSAGEPFPSAGTSAGTRSGTTASAGAECPAAEVLDLAANCVYYSNSSSYQSNGLVGSGTTGTTGTTGTSAGPSAGGVSPLQSSNLRKIPALPALNPPFLREEEKSENIKVGGEGETSAGSAGAQPAKASEARTNPPPEPGRHVLYHIPKGIERAINAQQVAQRLDWPLEQVEEELAAIRRGHPLFFRQVTVGEETRYYIG